MRKRNDDDSVRLRPNVFRIILGVIAGYFVPLFSLFFVKVATSFYLITQQGRWDFWILVVIFYTIAISAPFYFYGWLHKTLWLFKGSEDWWARWMGRIFGGIGYVLQPIVLLLYGHNKKWLYFILVGIPSLIVGGAALLDYLNIMAFPLFQTSTDDVTFHMISLQVAIAFFLNTLLAICTKRCPECGAMMTRIEHSLDGKSYTKYARYDDVDFYGDNLEIGKYYVCTNCYHVKKGIGFSVQTDGYVDV